MKIDPDAATALRRHPGSFPRCWLAFHWIKGEVPSRAKILDVGCFTGHFARCVAEAGYFAFGIDINRAAIGYASRIPTDGAFFFWYKGDRFPFENKTFDCVTLLDVLEHVQNEALIIEETHRVLKHDGFVVCSVPNRGRYDCLDPDNLKFRFPRAHKLFYALLGQRHVYLRKYRHDPLLFGNFARPQTGKLYHRHYSLEDLERLWGGSFRMLRVHRGGGVVFPLAYLGTKLWGQIFGRTFRPFSTVMARDFGKDRGSEAYNLQVLLKKIH